MLDANPLDKAVLDEIAADVPELTTIRRDIHAHPELGLEEHRTAAIVAEKLRSWGIETTTGIGGTGVVGTIRGRMPGQRAIGLRADMDALALVEGTGLSYASTATGRMHACGHDGHTTMLLGAAKALARSRDFAGTVHLIFQPAEEGRGGALAMLKDGLFDRFPCDAIYGLHNMPGLPVGKFSICRGPALAGSSRWSVTFTGPGGHGGNGPHLTSDLTIVLAHFIMGVQSIVSRNVPPIDTAVISIGSIHGGDIEAGNVMPSKIVVGGTARCFTPEVKAIIEKRLAEHARDLAALHGAEAETSIRWGAEPLVNHSEQTDVAIAAAEALVGKDNINGKARPVTGGEDFAHMLMQKPGAFIFMGNGVGPDGVAHGLHTPKYDFNDAAIAPGVGYWVSLVQQELKLTK